MLIYFRLDQKLKYNSSQTPEEKEIPKFNKKEHPKEIESYSKTTESENISKENRCSMEIVKPQSKAKMKSTEGGIKNKSNTILIDYKGSDFNSW